MNPPNPPSDASFTLTATIKSFPPGGGVITDFQLSANIQNGGNWLTFDPRRQCIQAATKIPPPGPTGKLVLPPPGTKVAFTFVAPGFLVTDVPDFDSAAFECQKVKRGNDGSASIEGVATPRAVKEGTSKAKYSLKLQRTGSSLEWIIDPDFETNVSTGNA